MFLFFMCKHCSSMAMTAGNNKNVEEEEEENGVLLYYKYFTNEEDKEEDDVEGLLSFYNSSCRSLSLLGRVRLSTNGVNVTVGGKLSALKKHIAEVSSNSLFKDTDFKLASCHQPPNDTVAQECGFTSLSIRIVKELVTFSAHPLLKSPEVSNSGKHLSAAEFHSVLQHAGNFIDGDRDGQDNNKNIVLLDARNLYETRIGKFQAPNVVTLDPEIRQYSDFHSWVADNSEQLRGKQILMYCTGGIRCEMASAYIRSRGDGFENVFQCEKFGHCRPETIINVMPYWLFLLYGGIQRYLEQFPDGGFFKGKNFVFDYRVSVGSSDTKIVGTCLLCCCEFDDYSSRSRCIYCRMLVLVCHSCQKEGFQYVCELCEKNDKVVRPIPSIEKEESQEFSTNNEPGAVVMTDHSLVSPQLSLSLGSRYRPQRKLRILCLHGFRQNASSFRGRTASLAKKLKNIAELVFTNAPHELLLIYQPPISPNDFAPSPVQQRNLPSESCSKRFAWFISPNSGINNFSGWQMADSQFDPLQYEQQTDGLDISFKHLHKIVQEEGPFDGILGFSQGAAMVASVLAQQRMLKSRIYFRFAILCSGFAPNLGNYEKGLINCPSLHIFGNSQGNDRQIANQASRKLYSLFDDGSSMIIEHEFGHIIPTKSPYIDEVKEFLHRFL